MAERVLNEFTVRVGKAKNQLQETTNQCEILKKELLKLKKVAELLGTRKGRQRQGGGNQIAGKYEGKIPDC
jgi:hypothetical protein